LYSTAAENHEIIGHWDVVVNLSDDVKELLKGEIISGGDDSSSIHGIFNIDHKYDQQKIEIRTYFSGNKALTISEITIKKKS
jgi:hypothetical protein